MTDKVFPSPDRDMTTKILGQIMEYAGGSDPGWVVTSGAKIAGSARNGFGESSSGASLDVIIDTGEAFVQGCWVDRDITTTVTLAASTSDQSVYVGLDLSMKNTVIVGLNADFAADDPKMAIWTFGTDGSGVTSSADERYTAPGRGLTVPNADNADNADKLDGKHWVLVASGNIVVASDFSEDIALRSGGHNYYRYSAYTESILVILAGGGHNITTDGFIDSYLYASVEKRPIGASDKLTIKNHSSTGYTVYYEVYSWE